MTISGGTSVDDRIEEAARLFGSVPTRGIADFARFCRREGYLDSYPAESAIEQGDIDYIKSRFKRRVNGVSAWINTGEDGEWLSRRACTADQHLQYCRLLKKKRDEIDGQLKLELDFRADRGWPVTCSDDL